MHSNCPFDKACVNGQCQSPCNIGGMCGVNTICRAERHEAQCSCLAGYTGDPLKQCVKLTLQCEENKDCGNGFVCANNVCKGLRLIKYLVNLCLNTTLTFFQISTSVFRSESPVVQAPVVPT